MQDPAYMPTVIREPEQIGRVARNDPLHMGSPPYGTRFYSIFNEPDRELGEPEEWAGCYAEAYWAIYSGAIGPVSVGGVNLTQNAIGDDAWLQRFLDALHPYGAKVDWLGVHAYGDMQDVLAYVRWAQELQHPALADGFDVKLTEVGHLCAFDWDTAQKQVNVVREFVAQHAAELRITDVFWFVSWDPTFPGWWGWNDRSPCTVVYHEDGSLTPTGQSYARALSRAVYLPRVS